MAEVEWNARARAEAKLGRLMSETEWDREWARRQARQDAARRRREARRSAKEEIAQAFNRDEAIGRRAARRSKSVGATLKIGAAAAVGGILYGLFKRRSR